MTGLIRWEPNEDGRDSTAAFRGYAGTPDPAVLIAAALSVAPRWWRITVTAHRVWPS